MNKEKQAILIIGLILTGSIIVVFGMDFFIFKGSNFNWHNNILFLGISILIFLLCIVLIIKEENKHKTLKKESIRNATYVLVDWIYSKEEWESFAKKSLKSQMLKYYSKFFTICFCIILFLFIIHLYKCDKGIINALLFFFLSFSLPILIASLLKFKQYKTIYYKTLNPSVRITKDGFLINNEIAHPFNSQSRIKEASIEYFRSIRCLMLEIMHPVKGGAQFKKHYFPIPQQDNLTEKEIDKIIFSINSLKTRL